MRDAAFLPLRLDHRLAFRHDFRHRGRLQGERKLAGFDLRQIEDFVDEFAADTSPRAEWGRYSPSATESAGGVSELMS